MLITQKYKDLQGLFEANLKDFVDVYYKAISLKLDKLFNETDLFDNGYSFI